MKFPVLAGFLALVPAIAGAEVKSATPDAMLIELALHDCCAGLESVGNAASIPNAGGLPTTPGPAGART